MQKAPKRFDGSLAAFTGLEMSLFSIPRLIDHRNFQVVDSIYFFFSGEDDSAKPNISSGALAEFRPVSCISKVYLVKATGKKVGLWGFFLKFNLPFASPSYIIQLRKN